MKTSDVFIGALDVSPYFQSLKRFDSHDYYDSHKREETYLYLAFPPEEKAIRDFENLLLLDGKIACYVLGRADFGEVKTVGNLNDMVWAQACWEKGKSYCYPFCFRHSKGSRDAD